MKFSLITSTINRCKELVLLFESLKTQTFKDFELIVVDQNSTNDLANIIESYQPFFNIIYTKSVKGLSVGRNTGLKKASGDIICFPDDDCEYPVDLLEQVNCLMTTERYDMVTCRVIDKLSGKEIGIRWLKHDGPVSIGNIFQTTSSVSFFVTRDALGDMTFDERLGAGSAYGSGEETDLIYRLLLKKVNAKYFFNILVYHPHNELDYFPENDKKIYLYSRGLGAFYKKHLFHKTNPAFIVCILKSMLLSPVIGLLRRLFCWKRLHAKWISVIGLWNGFLTFQPGENTTPTQGDCL